MKILIISDAWLPQLNGVVRTYEYLRDYLERAGHAVKIIGPADFKFRIPMPGYAEIHLALLPNNQIKKTIEDFQPDTIHLATEGPLGWAARQYCLKHNLKFTSCYHTQFPEYVARRVAKIFPFLYQSIHKAGVFVVRKFHNASSALLVTTESMMNELRSWNIKTPIYKFTRGIDAQLFYPGEKRLFQDLPQPIALYVGRLAIEKSVEKFLDMEWPGSKIVVGHGPDEAMLKKRYPQAHFTGKKTGTELADHYRSADVLVFPSRTDTFGMVILEALACGLPVAAHNVTGPRDIIEHAGLGILDENLSIAAHRAIRLGSPKERNDFVMNNYSWEKAAEQFLEVSELYRITQ